jgi:formylglycine-generating enzyme required for sulfatase activity
MPTELRDVRSEGQSGKHMLALRRGARSLHGNDRQLDCFRDCSGSHLRIPQPALAQNAQTIADVPSVQSTLPATAEDLKDLRLARPLSRNEEIAVRPLDQFKECEKCPEMIMVPAGHFLMGAKDGEAASSPDEGPQREVSFARPFAIGRFTVTMSEWDACVAAGGCSYRPVDQGWGRGRQPAINLLCAASSGTVQARPTFACIASTARRTLRGNNGLFDDLSEPAIISKSYKPRSYVSIAAKRFRFRIVVSQTG